MSTRNVPSPPLLEASGQNRAAAVNSIQIKAAGTIRLHNIKTVEHANGNLVAVSRSGEVVVADEVGRERERYKLPYGATLRVGDGDAVDESAHALDVVGRRAVIHHQPVRFGMSVFGSSFEPFAFMVKAPGAFLCLGILLGLMNAWSRKRGEIFVQT